jgi:hypothetical protein
MKQILLFTILCCSWIFPSYAQTNILHSYPFNGNANDIVGTKHGTVNGAVLCPDRFGNANSAYQFNGTSDYILLNHNFGAYTEFSVSAWFKCTGATSDPVQAIFSSDNSNKFIHMNFNTSASPAGIAIYANPSAAIILNSTSNALNVWHQWTITCKTGETKFYVDGVLQGTSTTTFTSVAAANLMRIGSGYLNGRFFKGVIDDIKIYNSALTNLQVLGNWTFENGQQFLKPGSGSCLYFDGIDDYLHFGNAHIPTGNFTVEFWVKNLLNTGAYREFVSQGTAGSAFYIGLDPTGKLRCGDTWQTTNTTVLHQQWTHVALVKSGTNGSLYINGILQATKTGFTINANGPLRIGKQYGANGEYAKCFIDEFRVWNAPLTQTDIQERMCRKITAEDPISPNLLAYLNFDEATNSNYAYDAVSNADNGILSNGAQRPLSGAPIGNVSAYQYAGNNSTVTLNMPGRGDAFTCSALSYNPQGTEGIHVYAVTELPNITNYMDGLGDNNKYVGNFIVGGNPIADISYYYNGIPGASGCNEGSLKLYSRLDNSNSWMNALGTLNTTAHTLSQQMARNEFMIGSSGYPLAASSVIAPQVIDQTEYINCAGFYWVQSQTGYYGNGIHTVTDGCFTYNLTTIEDQLEVTSSNGSTPICEGSAVTLNCSIYNEYYLRIDDGINPTIYSENISSTYVSHANPFSMIVTPSVTTTYTITAVQSWTNCVYTTTHTIDVLPKPTLTLNNTPTNPYSCGGSAVTLSASGNATSYTWNQGVSNGVSFVPTTTNYYTVTGMGANGCPANATVQVPVYAACTATLNVSMLLEGYYDPNLFKMIPVLYNLGIHPSPFICDTVTIALHESNPPYALQYEEKGLLDIYGNVQVSFPYNVIGSDYYLAVKHRSSLETWSADPITMDPLTAYDFMYTDINAYGGNQAFVEPVMFAIFTGDINQDGYIDSFDFPALDTDIFNGVSGVYFNTDLNGDGFVDSFDFPLFDANSYNGVSIMTP